jgi:hypothetical protein
LGFYFIAKMVHIYVAILLALITIWARGYPWDVLATCCCHTCQGRGEGDETWLQNLSISHNTILPPDLLIHLWYWNLPMQPLPQYHSRKWPLMLAMITTPFPLSDGDDPSSYTYGLCYHSSPKVWEKEVLWSKHQ